MGIQTIFLVIVVVVIGFAALFLRQRYYESMVRREREWKSEPPPPDTKPSSEGFGGVRRQASGLFDEPIEPPAPPAAESSPALRGGKSAPGGPPADDAKKEADQDDIPSPSVSIALGALSGLTGAPPVFQPPAKPKPTPAHSAPPPPPPAAAPAPAPQSSGGATPTNAPAPAQDVRFTAYYPKEAAVETWYTLLVYAHIDSALTKVQADAAKFKDEMGGMPRETKSAAPAHLVRGTEIRIVPECDGVTFNPPQVSLKWIEDIHRADFRLQASKDMAGEAANLRVTIFVGPLIVATIKGGILFDDTAPQSGSDSNTASTSATMYKAEQIFPSYSHSDEKVVLACRNAYRAIGFDYLRDRDILRPGENWSVALLSYIDRADIFQLFWSASSSASPYVRQEWEYALRISGQKDPGFIRPVYWEQPMPVPPAELEPLNFTYVPLTTP